MATTAQVSDHQHAAAFDNGHLSVSELHEVYYEQYGKKGGKPVIFLHGGPGGGTSPENASFFDPAIYHVVLLDQRGCGKSKPFAETRENTSQLLASDIEALRKHLGIPKWHLVFGGSWGSTLALLYAQTYPEIVGSLLLRGIFTGRKIEFDYTFTPHGAAMLYPEAYEAMINYLPAEDRANPPAGYQKLFASPDKAARHEACKVWNTWEFNISKVEVPASDFERLDEDETYNLAHATMECHYFVNGLFLEEGQLLRKENVDRIRNIPCTIVQGRLDLVCPPRTAWDLHQAWPESRLYMMPASGHSAKEPRIYSKLVEVCNEYARLDFV